MTGSAKTGHNCTILNSQYNALNTCTLDACLRINEKICFRTLFFLVKEGIINKNLESSYSPPQKGLENLYFVAVDDGHLFMSRQSDHTQSIFLHESCLFFCSEEGLVKGKRTQ